MKNLQVKKTFLPQDIAVLAVIFAAGAACFLSTDTAIGLKTAKVSIGCRKSLFPGTTKPRSLPIWKENWKPSTCIPRSRAAPLWKSTIVKMKTYGLPDSLIMPTSRRESSILSMKSLGSRSPRWNPLQQTRND